MFSWTKHITNSRHKPLTCHQPSVFLAPDGPWPSEDWWPAEHQRLRPRSRRWRWATSASRVVTAAGCESPCGGSRSLSAARDGGRTFPASTAGRRPSDGRRICSWANQKWPLDRWIGVHEGTMFSGKGQFMTIQWEEALNNLKLRHWMCARSAAKNTCLLRGKMLETSTKHCEPSLVRNNQRS